MCCVYFCGFNGFNQWGLQESCESGNKLKYFKSNVKQLEGNCRLIAHESNDSVLVQGLLGKDETSTIRDLRVDPKLRLLAVTDDLIYFGNGGRLHACSTSSGELKEMYNFLKRKNVLQRADNSDSTIATRLEESNGICKIVSASSLRNGGLVMLLSNGQVVEMSPSSLEVSVKYKGELDKAVDVSCGFEHVLIATESGCLLSYGVGSRGQLGLNDLSSSSTPVQVPALEGMNMIGISAGGWHSAAITDNGDLFMWGWNNHGQLGTASEGVVVTPTLVNIEENVLEVRCGARHTIILLGNGSLQSCGWNGYGQLGLESDIDVSTFTTISIPLKIKSAVKRLKCLPWATVVFVNQDK